MIAVFSLTASAWAANFQDGLRAYEKGDYTSAFMEWLPLAEHGKASAQFNIGLLLAEGKAGPKNIVHGYAWVTLAVQTLEPGEQKNHVESVRKKIAADMTKEQIEEAETLVKNWGEKIKEATPLEETPSVQGQKPLEMFEGQEPVKKDPKAPAPAPDVIESVNKEPKEKK